MYIVHNISTLNFEKIKTDAVNSFLGTRLHTYLGLYKNSSREPRRLLYLLYYIYENEGEVKINDNRDNAF